MNTLGPIFTAASCPLRIRLIKVWYGMGMASAASRACINDRMTLSRLRVDNVYAIFNAPKSISKGRALK